MLTTAGIAFLAASAYVLPPGAGVAVAAGAVAVASRNSTTLLPLAVSRGSRSGRSVATTNSAPTHSVHACANSSQTFRSRELSSPVGGHYSGRGATPRRRACATLQAPYLRRLRCKRLFLHGNPP